MSEKNETTGSGAVAGQNDGLVMPVLPIVEMKAEALIKGAMYLWKLPCGETKVVWLSDDETGLDEWDDGWEFENDLAGQLYGPVGLEA